MKNYNIHNDLITNFFCLVNKIDTYLSKQNSLEIHYLDEDIVEQTEEPTTEEYLEYEYVIELLQNIYPILKLKYNTSIFEDYKHLLISRFLYPNWRILIKKEIDNSLQQNKSFSFFQNQILASLKEIQLRSNLDFTYDLYNGFNKSNFYNLAYQPIFFNVFEDINWIKSLNEKDIKLHKVKLHPNLSKLKLINIIDTILKDRYINKIYKKEFKLEIERFIDFIINPYNNIDFNLSFIKSKNQIIKFSKIFFYIQNKKLIISTKNELNYVFSDTLNISKRSLEKITNKTITDELNKDTGIAYIINKHLLKQI